MLVPGELWIDHTGRYVKVLDVRGDIALVLDILEDVSYEVIAATGCMWPDVGTEFDLLERLSCRSSLRQGQ